MHILRHERVTSGVPQFRVVDIARATCAALPPDRPTRPTPTPPHTRGMRWLSTDGAWTVVLADFGDYAWVEIAHGGELRWCGMVELWRAHSGINAALAELGGPALEDMVER